jgi:hypothetical protein
VQYHPERSRVYDRLFEEFFSRIKDHKPAER